MPGGLLPSLPGKQAEQLLPDLLKDGGDRFLHPLGGVFWQPGAGNGQPRAGSKGGKGLTSKERKTPAFEQSRQDEVLDILLANII